MNPWVIILLLLFLIGSVLVCCFLIKKSKLTLKQTSSVIPQRNNDTNLSVKFEDLPALTDIENSSLVEIEDEQLLARIDNVIPGTLQVIANAGAVKNYQQAVKNAGQLYQAIIPKGAKLADSQAIKGAVRGVYHGPKGIKGHANLVPVDGNMGNELAVMNVANAAMSVTSMVVGQYFMTQINDQLREINKELDKLASFQNNEFLSKIYAIVAETQTCSQFRLEIIENEELRKRELDHLKSIEHECAELLGQANLTLKGFEKKTGLSYSDYEKLVAEAEKWYQYQQILLQLIQKITELTYTLYLGGISKEHCYSKVLPYVKQADDALASVEAWHKKNCKSLEIDLETGRRHRQGFDDILHFLPSLFDDSFQYKDISPRTVSFIVNQSSGQRAPIKEKPDLFKEDVRLIAKDGKLYYLPQTKEDLHNNENTDNSNF